MKSKWRIAGFIEAIYQDLMIIGICFVLAVVSTMARSEIDDLKERVGALESHIKTLEQHLDYEDM